MTKVVLSKNPRFPQPGPRDTDSFKQFHYAMVQWARDVAESQNHVVRGEMDGNVTAVTDQPTTVTQAIGTVTRKVDPSETTMSSGVTIIQYGWMTTVDGTASAASSVPLYFRTDAAENDYGETRAHFWLNVNMVGTASVRDSVNIASITDNGPGDLTIFVDTDFGNGNWSPYTSGMANSAGGTVVVSLIGSTSTGTAINAGAVRVTAKKLSNGAAHDPIILSVGGFGTQ